MMLFQFVRLYGMKWITINDKLGRTWKKAVVTYLRLLAFA